MLQLEEAIARLLATVPPLPLETISVSEATGRVLAKSAVASVNLPSFDNSAMDGYAVRAEDVAEATVERPQVLRVLGQIAAGESRSIVVERGDCVRVFTGSPLPPGADAVVMQEDTRLDQGEPNRVRVIDPVKPWENVRFKGEDVKSGVTLLSAGERVTARHVGLFAAAGLAKVDVHRQPVIGLLATGNELVEPGVRLTPGRIYESNRSALAPLVQRSGGKVRVLPLVADTLEATREGLLQAFAECDGVISTGGVSVGELDFVKDAFTRIGGNLDLWKIAIKPGKPFVFGHRNGKFLFGLPGNPVSALVTFLLLVRPALWRWQGATSTPVQMSRGTLAEPMSNDGDRRHFVRVFIDSNGTVKSTGAQASHMLSSLAAANGLVDVPPKAALEAGTSVSVLLFGD